MLMGNSVNIIRGLFHFKANCFHLVAGVRVGLDHGNDQNMSSVKKVRPNAANLVDTERSGCTQE